MTQAAQQQPLEEITFLKLEEVARRTTLSTRTIKRRIVAGTFPKPVRLGPRNSVWVEREIQDWMAAAVEAARATSSSLAAASSESR